MNDLISFDSQGNLICHSRTPGSKNGIRLYQNEDGSYTELGAMNGGRYSQHNSSGSSKAEEKANAAREKYFSSSARKQASLQKKDMKWLYKNQDKLTKQATKGVSREDTKAWKQEVKAAGSQYSGKNYLTQISKISAAYVNKGAEAKELYSKYTGQAVVFLAQRGDINVRAALTYNRSNASAYKNGIYADGRQAYHKDGATVYDVDSRKAKHSDSDGETFYSFDSQGNIICHHRTPGSKNGVRLYQNEDGSYTELGAMNGGRYSQHKGSGDKKAAKEEKKAAKVAAKAEKKATKAIKGNENASRLVNDDTFKQSVSVYKSAADDAVTAKAAQKVLASIAANKAEAAMYRAVGAILENNASSVEDVLSGIQFHAWDDGDQGLGDALAVVAAGVDLSKANEELSALYQADADVMKTASTCLGLRSNADAEAARNALLKGDETAVKLCTDNRLSAAAYEWRGQFSEQKISEATEKAKALCSDYGYAGANAWNSYYDAAEELGLSSTSWSDLSLTQINQIKDLAKDLRAGVKHSDSDGETFYSFDSQGNLICHSRTPGSKNGVRLYQNEDGSYTELGAMNGGRYSQHNSSSSGSSSKEAKSKEKFRANERKQAAKVTNAITKQKVAAANAKVVQSKEEEKRAKFTTDLMRATTVAEMQKLIAETQASVAASKQAAAKSNALADIAKAEGKANVAQYEKKIATAKEELKNVADNVAQAQAKKELEYMNALQQYEQLARSPFKKGLDKAVEQGTEKVVSTALEVGLTTVLSYAGDKANGNMTLKDALAQACAAKATGTLSSMIGNANNGKGGNTIASAAASAATKFQQNQQNQKNTGDADAAVKTAQAELDNLKAQYNDLMSKKGTKEATKDATQQAKDTIATNKDAIKQTKAESKQAQAENKAAAKESKNQAKSDGKLASKMKDYANNAASHNATYQQRVNSVGSKVEAEKKFYSTSNPSPGCWNFVANYKASNETDMSVSELVQAYYDHISTK